MSENRLFDKRCAKHYISTGVLNPEVFRQHLEALPDIAEKACPIEVKLEGEAPEEEAAAEESAEASVPAETAAAEAPTPAAALRPEEVPVPTPPAATLADMP